MACTQAGLFNYCFLLLLLGAKEVEAECMQQKKPIAQYIKPGINASLD
jgi:hypothetical protein